MQILLLSLVYYRIWDIYRDFLHMDLFHFRGKFFLIGLYIIIAYLTFRACESFRYDKLKFVDLSISQCISCLIINFITWLQICLVVNGLITPTPLLLLTVLDFLICIVFSRILTRYFRRKGGLSDALLIYGSDAALGLKKKLDNNENGFGISEAAGADLPYEELCTRIDRHANVLINDVPGGLRNDLLKYCFSHRKTTYVVPKITDIILKGSEELNTLDTPILRVNTEGLNPAEAFVKRMMDLLLTVIAMVPCSLLMLLIAAAIKTEDGGPVFYRQKRVTKDGAVFDILKFRSMIVNAEESTGAVLASEDDPRITKVGRFLRSCRLDELPQLINILKGEMSLVGPRPERVELTDEFCREMPEFAYRTMVKGGLTGYAQVYGKYNTTVYDKLRLDMIYIEQYSLLLDIKLILMTPQILFRKEAAEGVRGREEKEIPETAGMPANMTDSGNTAGQPENSGGTSVQPESSSGGAADQLSDSGDAPVYTEKTES